MSLPTHEALLREQFESLKAQAQSLVATIAESASPQYAALSELLPRLQEYAAFFKEPIAFTVPSGSGLAMKAAVIQAIGPTVTES